MKTLIAIAAALSISAVGCQNGQLPPQVAPAVVDTLELGACMLGVQQRDQSTNPPAQWATVAVDMATMCGVDVKQILGLFGPSAPVSQAAVANATSVHKAALAHKAAQ